MKLASDGKINAEGVISSNELITEKEGYEAMLYMLKANWEYDSRLGRRWNLDPHTRQSYFTTELEKEVEAFQYEHIFLFLWGS